MDQLLPPYDGFVKTPIENSEQLFMLIFPWFLVTLAIASTAFRLAARRAKKISLGWDDWLCLVATLVCVALQLANTIAVIYGGSSLPFLSLSVAQWIVFFKAIGAEILLWICGVAILQTSILFMYLRIFQVKKSFRVACYVVMGIIAAWWVAAFFVVLFECNPVSKVWIPYEQGTCIDERKMCSSTGIAHVLLDFIILALPLPVIFRLQTAKSNKILMTAIFGVGLIATVASILRMECLVTLIKVEASDPTATLWLSDFFQILEMCLGVFCVCVPTMAPIWRAVKTSRLGSYLRSLISRTRTSQDGHPSQATGTETYINATARARFGSSADSQRVTVKQSKQSSSDADSIQLQELPMGVQDARDRHILNDRM